MRTKNASVTKPPANDTKKRPLIPWVVQQGDFRRYVGRAINRCRQGGVVFMYGSIREGGKTKRLGWFSLSPINHFPDPLIAAAVDIDAGRFRRVTLAKLPRLIACRKLTRS